MTTLCEEGTIWYGMYHNVVLVLSNRNVVCSMCITFIVSIFRIPPMVNYLPDNRSAVYRGKYMKS